MLFYLNKHKDNQKHSTYSLSNLFIYLNFMQTFAQKVRFEKVTIIQYTFLKSFIIQNFAFYFPHPILFY